MNKKYTDLQRKFIAEKEYDKSLTIGDPVTIGNKNNKTTIGTVVDVIDQPDNGLHMTVVRSQTFVLPYKISNSACFIV